MEETKKHRKPDIDYRLLRFIIFLIALLLPVIVTEFFTIYLNTISEAYWKITRNGFVGLLFVVGAFLFVYSGHKTSQSILSKVGGVAAVCVACIPAAEKATLTDIGLYFH
ncbi:MAG: hypothetical protein JW969_03395, partial [Spirochaetales bacterium]|nr:hypothetical protein [Spirochaetales bacterium]